MKKLFFILAFVIAGAISAYSASEVVVKFYMSDGTATQIINIADIAKMAVKNVSNNYGMMIYKYLDYFDSYAVSNIDSMKFAYSPNKLLNVYSKGTVKSYLISNLDSIIFLPIEIYNTVTIGTQVWTSRNLNVSHYRNGDTIPEVRNFTTWAQISTGAWCYYNNDTAKGAVYGKLYNKYAVLDPRGLAPIGYHIPSKAEWDTLAAYLGGVSVAGGKLKEAGTTHWTTPNTDATNSSFFSALPGGKVSAGSGFVEISTNGYWWSVDMNYCRVLNYNTSSITTTTESQNGYYYGFSVRLIKD
jgi:uncharacterized protein (TIGR02145 family)